MASEFKSWYFYNVVGDLLTFITLVDRQPLISVTSNLSVFGVSGRSPWIARKFSLRWDEGKPIVHMFLHRHCSCLSARWTAHLYGGVKRTFIPWFTDIGKSFTDIGKWITDIGKWFTDIGKSSYLPISVNELPISVNRLDLPISVNHLPISVIQAYLPISVNAWLALDTRHLDFSWSKNRSKAREYSSHSNQYGWTVPPGQRFFANHSDRHGRPWRSGWFDHGDEPAVPDPGHRKATR